MANTVWNQWYYQDRFLGKPYPFVDNIPKPKRQPDDEDLEEGEEKEVTS